MEYERPFAPVQWAAIIGSIGVLFWSVPGIFVNPDFATGDSATAERVMGVDMNGWHALSGFLLVLPLPIALMRARYAALFCLAAAVGLSATGVWALLDSQVAGGLFYLPNGGADALLHFSVAAIFLAGATHYFLTERRQQQYG